MATTVNSAVIRTNVPNLGRIGKVAVRNRTAMIHRGELMRTHAAEG
jgi:hypothetical protein